MKNLLQLLTLITFTTFPGSPAHTQVELVTEINALGAQPVYPNYFVSDGNILYYVASGVNSNELWKTDGTNTGTIRIKQFDSYSEIKNLTNVDGTIYIEAFVPFNGSDIWKTDGTEAGTVLVKDLPDYYSDPAAFKGFSRINNELVFVYNDGVNGAEIWKTDGTESGTVLLKDIYPGSSSSNPILKEVLNGELYFVANNGNSGTELWKTNGTTAGTTMVSDINAGAGDSNPTHMITFGDSIYFLAYTPTSGYEFWVSDGTNSGTSIVYDYTGGSGSTYAASLEVYNDRIYFPFNNTVGVIIPQTSFITTIGTNCDALFTFNFGSNLYFSSINKLWKYDGLNTVLVKEFEDYNWAISDQNTFPSHFTILNNELYFQFHDTLWITDGTEIGTQIVGDGIVSDSHLDGYHQYSMVEVNDLLFFSGNGNILWKSDGTAIGTDFLQTPSSEITSSLNAGSENFNEAFLVINDELYFSANDGLRGWELWKTDGTGTGTSIVKDLNTSPQIFGSSTNSYPTHFLNFNDELVFTTYSTSSQYLSLWKSDGTNQGTMLIKDSLPNGYMDTIVAVQNLFFFPNYSEEGIELWKSDGTESGTTLVRDITYDPLDASVDANSSYPHNFLPVDNTLYFVCNDLVHGKELWKTDGSENGTVMVKDIYPGPDHSNISSLIEIDGILYFTADNGINGPELWTSDGTESGTNLLIDLHSNPAYPAPQYLTPFADGFVFTTYMGPIVKHLPYYFNTINNDTIPLLEQGYDAEGYALDKKFLIKDNAVFFMHGGILWKSDGTTSSTIQLTQNDINYFYRVLEIHGEANGEIYFSSLMQYNSGDVFFCKTDGTPCGTVVITDPIGIGYQSSVLPFMNGFIFPAYSNEYGEELFKLTPQIFNPGTVNVNIYANASAANTCNGQLIVEISGDETLPVNNNFAHLYIDGNDYGSIYQQRTQTDLCPGVYEITLTNSCIDSTFTYVVPVDTNYFVHNPYTDSIAVDTLGYLVANCDFEYTDIYTAYIETTSVQNDTVSVIWTIIDAAGTHQETAYYVIDSSGIYAFQITVYCPTKMIGDYFGALDMIHTGSLGITESKGVAISLFPNPTNDLVTISFEGNQAELTVYDAQGKLVQNRSTIHSGEEVSLANVETGVYFFELSTSEGNVVKRVVKQ